LYSGDDVVGASRGGLEYKQFGVFRFNGECTEALELGEELRGHGIAVLIAGDPWHNPSAQYVPLGPGRFVLSAEVLWGDWALKTNTVPIEIAAPDNTDDLCASEMVDASFASFMSPMPTMGLASTETGTVVPVGSVKRILEECPESVHARIAKSRLLMLQAEKLSTRAMPQQNPELRRQLMLETVKSIDRRLRTQNADPLELELLDAKVKLLHRVADDTALRQAIDALVTRYPDSARARRAEGIRRERHLDSPKEE